MEQKITRGPLCRMFALHLSAQPNKTHQETVRGLVVCYTDHVLHITQPLCHYTQCIKYNMLSGMQKVTPCWPLYF